MQMTKKHVHGDGDDVLMKLLDDGLSGLVDHGTMEHGTCTL